MDRPIWKLCLSINIFVLLFSLFDLINCFFAIFFEHIGSKINLGVLVYEPPRNGPTLWEIGFPDRSAAEFFVPDPYPTLANQLYTNHRDKSALNYHAQILGCYTITLNVHLLKFQ